MLHDLLQMNLGAWHPRHVPQTSALQAQKAHSLPPLTEWWEGMLQGGSEAWLAPFKKAEWPAGKLFEGARDSTPALKNYSDRALAMFLLDMGATKRHIMTGNKWTLPSAADARASFEARFGRWNWREALDDWETKPSSRE
jgi:hypothetical protein